MRCTHCNRELLKKSSYCSHCGAELSLFRERQWISCFMNVYPFWLVLHLLLLFLSDNPFHSSSATGGLSAFWPLNEGADPSKYDLTEFIIYAGIPLFFIILFVLQNRTHMTVAVIGSRSFTDYEMLRNTLRCIYITEIISGDDTGADQLAERYAKENNIRFRVIPHDENPDAASSERAYTLIRNAQLVIAFWDGKSQGTNDMINYARRKGKQFKIKYFKVDGEE